jgi:hypothetical protein
MILNIVFQFILAIIILFTIFKFALPFLLPDTSQFENPRDLFITKQKDYSVKIVEGIMPINSSEVFVTTGNKFDVDYVEVPKSNNSKNGAQFSFSFWLNKGKNTDMSVFADKILLIFGLKNKETLVTKMPANLESNILDKELNLDSHFEVILEPKTSGDTVIYPSTDPNTQNYRTFRITKDRDVTLKCPLIKFGKDGTSIEVDFNTNKNVDNKFVINSDILNLLSGNVWNMLTFTFEDYKDITGFANGIKITVYINQKQIYTYTLKQDSLKLNDGHIYVLPTMSSQNKSTNDAAIADVTYYNRALNIDELKKIVAAQFNDGVYKTPRMKQKNTAQKKYAEISLYNETYEL